jgi:hypothetical protein
MGHSIQLHKTNTLSTKHTYMDCIIRDITEIEHHPNNMNEGLWKIIGRLSYSILDLGSPSGQKDPSTLPLSEHQLCHLQACINPKPLPSCPDFLHFFPLSFTACLVPCSWLLCHIPPFSAYHTLSTFPYFSYTTTYKALFRPMLIILVMSTIGLLATCFTQVSCFDYL